MKATGPNAQQIEYWNEVSGPKWVSLGDVVNAQIEPLGHEAMDRAELAPGMKVLDVGCGCGLTTIDLAARVGGRGHATGIDISRPMLESAAQRAADAGATNLELVNADAQTHRFREGAFDRVFSRFGVMFFADPVAAFSNLHGSLSAGGRLAFVCWQELARNPWMAVPLAAVAAHVDAPPPPDAPGPFSFADPERVSRVLETAGFSSIEIEPLERNVLVAGGMDLERASEFVLQMGPTGAAIRTAPVEKREAALSSVRNAVAPYATERGLEMGASAWLATASRIGRSPAQTPN